MARFEKPSWPAVAVIMILLIILAGFVPATYTATNGQDSETHTLEEGESITLHAPLSTTLTTVTNTQANVTLVDTQTGDTATTGLLNESETSTLTLRNESINLTYAEDIGNNQAIILYEYPSLYQMNDTARAYINVVAVIVLVLFLYLILTLIQTEANA